LLIVISWLYKVWSVPEVLRPLYESSKILAQKMTIAVRMVTLEIILSFISSLLFVHIVFIILLHRPCDTYDRLHKRLVGKFNMVGAASLLF
jgi:nitrogen fixation/metabolism regulation signal transduction histidine kinase